MSRERPPNALSLPPPAPRGFSPRLAGVLLLPPVSILTGCACAFFLWSLDAVTRIRFAHPELLFGLPLAGWIMIRVYQTSGKGSDAGARSILAEVESPTPDATRIPRRMAPFILFSTLVTHLCGGSAGREGTAVQMGGSLAATLLRRCVLPPETVHLVLLGGIAAGFGGVFGTPLAGAVFAAEITRSRRGWRALPFFAGAAFLSDATCQLWGITHTAYTVAPATASLLPTLAELLRIAPAVAAASVALGACAHVYLRLTESYNRLLQRLFPRASTHAVIGGLLVIILHGVVGIPDYLGLGVLAQTPESVTLPGFFQSPEIHPWSWLWKMLFTVLTLGSGFRGGDVTPLFFMGAALGNALSGILGAPPDFLAGLGMVALFGAAANTPCACWMLGMELFGSHHALWIGITCWVAARLVGFTPLYAPAQTPPPKQS
jgi:H+/Cl- antiporter ClcA